MAECINFDGETEEGLAEIAKKLDKEINDLTLQRRYITEASKARYLRKDGQINAAIKCEQLCDRIHKMLPEELRW